MWYNSTRKERENLNKKIHSATPDKIQNHHQVGDDLENPKRARPTEVARGGRG